MRNLVSLSRPTTPSPTPRVPSTSSWLEKVFRSLACLPDCLPARLPACLPRRPKRAADASAMIGTYVLRDDLHLATPPPHPSEAPVQSNNPLATTISPPTAGTKLSLVALAPRQPSQSQLYRFGTRNSTRSQVPQSIQ